MMRITAPNNYADEELHNYAHFNDGVSLVRSEVIFLDKNATFSIGANSKLRDAKITLGTGASVTIGENSTVDGELFIGAYSSATLGDDLRITHAVYIRATERTSIIIGHDCLFASNIVLRAADGHPIYCAYSRERINLSKDISVGDHVWVGDDVRIFKGVSIGDASVIGAGAIVTRNIEKNSLAAGVPARVIRSGITWEHSNQLRTEQYYLSIEERMGSLLTDELEKLPPTATEEVEMNTKRDSNGGDASDERDYVLRGVRMSIPNRFLTPAIEHALKSEKYEGMEARQLPRFLSDGDRILELGAGLGFISAFANSLVKLDKCVVVEANPLLIPVIRKTHALNNTSAEIINAVALSDNSELRANVRQDGTIPFYITKNFWGASLTAVKEAISVETVSTLRINDLINDHKPSVLICDIEGGEIDILEGVELSCVKHALFEVHKNIIGLNGIHRLTATLATQGLYYNPDYSMGHVVLYSRS